MILQGVRFLLTGSRYNTFLEVALMNNGTVKWFNAEKGFGGYKTLTEGQKVTFEIEPDTRNSGRFRAVNVQPL